MSIKYEKVDKYTIRKINPKKVITATDHPTETKSTEWDYSFLLKQREAITKQRDEMIAKKEEELNEVETLIAEADKLGITKKDEEISA